MAYRITDRDLEGALETLNKTFGYKRKYIKSKAEYKGKSYTLDYSYGGVRLDVYGKTGSGVSTVSGRGTKKEIYNYIWAMIKGIRQYKNRNK